MRAPRSCPMPGPRKYIFVTGGVMSGLGKGVITASIAKLLRASGLNALPMKIDPYINVDAGTMNPVVHGEVYVTEDGGECDMDLGTYERFLGVDLTREHNVTTGQIYMAVIEAERRGDYLGECVQIIPHITNEIKRRIRGLAESRNADVLVVESGGTVGDIEGLPYLEAFRQMRVEEGRENTMFVHVTWGPVLPSVGEFKTKPTQHSVQELRRIGIQPDAIIVRSSSPMPEDAKRKIALYANVEQDAVFSSPDLATVYEAPLVLAGQGFLRIVERNLRLGPLEADLEEWRRIVEPFKVSSPRLRIAMVGKYSKLADSYVSVNHALMHAGARLGVRVDIDWLDSERYEMDPGALSELEGYGGVLIPGGFGRRGSEGMISVADYARRRSIPFLGICFGFQLASVSFARYVAGLEGANSTELDPSTPHPVVDLLPEQRGLTGLGGTMRLGAHEIEILPGTLASRIYGVRRILRRHRHRYEVNPEYLPRLRAAGLVYSAFSDSGRRAEILEIPGHPFYIATQYHPEFSSRPWEPEPVFLAFVSAARDRQLGVAARAALAGGQDHVHTERGRRALGSALGERISRPQGASHVPRLEDARAAGDDIGIRRPPPRARRVLAQHTGEPGDGRPESCRLRPRLRGPGRPFPPRAQGPRAAGRARDSDSLGEGVRRVLRDRRIQGGRGEGLQDRARQLQEGQAPQVLRAASWGMDAGEHNVRVVRVREPAPPEVRRAAGPRAPGGQVPPARHGADRRHAAQARPGGRRSCAAAQEDPGGHQGLLHGGARARRPQRVQRHDPRRRRDPDRLAAVHPLR